MLMSRNDTVTVADTSGKVLEAQERKFLYIRNSSSAGEKITLVLNNSVAAVSNEGIVLSPGQAFVETDSESFKCWRGEVQAISDVAGATISISERD